MTSDGTRRRIAAVVALVSLILSVALIAFAAAKNLGALCLTSAGVLVAVAGGWYAVSRRGAARAIATLLLIVGLAAMIGGFLIFDIELLPFIVNVLLGACSVGAARRALGRSTPELAARIASRVAVSAAVRPVLLMNPRSGGGKSERFHLVEECRARGIEPIVLAPGDDLTQLAENAILRGADAIGMAGGDGSQALVAEVASRSDIPQVVVPAGTRNHFALDLGLDRANVVGALDAFAEAIERRVDLASVNGRVFVNNASLGLYAKIVQSPDYRDAKLQTAAAVLPDLLGPGAEPLPLRFIAPDGKKHETAHVIIVSNDPYQLDEPGGRGTRERLDLGLLGVLAATISSASDAQRLVALDAVGEIRRFPGWQEWTTTRFEIDSDGPVEIGLDGEALTMEPPLVFETLPGALRIRLPPGAPGVSPAGRRLSRTSVLELFDLALGRG
jgi:diacylglycerol kinase family enzyme